MDDVTFTDWTNDDTVWQSFDRQITPAPEPSTYGLILVGLSIAGVGWRRWRRDRRAAQSNA